MKLIIFTLFALLFANCSHTNKEIVKNEDANLILCPKNITGCADRIVVDKIDYLIDSVTEDAKKDLTEITKKRKINDFQKIKVTVQGSTVKELGHFPNPMAEFDVFKLRLIKTR